ncbi:MAG: metal-dependent hydrolase [Candidatus Thermoplasmatota archaeon]|nr:metal-dependent hydrolase [Candidatus Thermoplasmatota archaeon]
MADLLTHAMVGFTIGTILSWRYKKIISPQITLIMVGTTLPDLIRIGLVLDPVKIEQLSGIPFSWTPLHTTGGVLIIIAIGSLLSLPKDHKKIFTLLAIGAVSHLFLDSLLITTSGYSYAVLWPFIDMRPSTPAFYLSTDVWPAFVTGLIALLVKITDTIE